MDVKVTSFNNAGGYVKCEAILSRLNLSEAREGFKTQPQTLPSWESIATLNGANAIDDNEVGQNIFRLRGFSNNDQWIFVDKVENKLGKNQKIELPFDTNEAMVAVNMADGHNEDVFRFDIPGQATEGWDWFDDSPSATAP